MSKRDPLETALDEGERAVMRALLVRRVAELRESLRYATASEHPRRGEIEQDLRRHSALLTRVTALNALPL